MDDVPAQDGDSEGRFQGLLATYGGALRRLSRVYLANPADQQDLFQEIALAIWTALPRFRGDASERTWIYRVAHNVALTYRAKHRRHHRDLPLEEDSAASPPQHDDRLDLYDMIRRLPAVDRQLLTLHLDGLTGPEIAAVTGLTTTNIGVRLMRARRKLTAAMQNSEE